MAHLTDRFETAQELLALPNQVLAGFLLEHLETMRKSDPRNSERSFSLRHTADSIAKHYAKKGFHRTTDLARAIAEAWNWLIAECLLAFDPEQTGGIYCFVTRRGVECSTREGVEEYRKRRLFSSDLLNETVRDCSLADYLAGDFEIAIFRAFRKIEIELRTACGYAAGETGVSLVRRAFHPAPDAGPLTLSSELPAQQQAMSDLFAGAIGRFRNSTAHGTRSFTDPIEAAQLLLFASCLMAVVDERRP